MLPLYLSIEGLYSYQNKQEIDFTKLTEAGLFGIFGAVGSGKSSVLEAISFALYGETERLNTKEKRSYNMMNLKSNNVVIDFQFLNFENKKFRFVAQWRRKKKFDDTTSSERSAYEWTDDRWIPLESTDGALVTNLSYLNFRRTIIIPQGQFKEFLELRGKERSEMMKEIFFLNKYDLGANVSHMLADTNKNLEHLKGVLSGYEEVNNEIFEHKNQQYQELNNSLTFLKKDYEQLKTAFQQLETSKKLRIDLQQKEDELSVLETKKAQIQNTEKQVIEFELLSNNFKEHINNFRTISANKSTLLTKIETLKESKDQLKEQIAQAEGNLAIATTEYSRLDELKSEIEDLKLLSQNIDTKQTLQEKELRIKNGREFLTNQLSAESNLNDKLIAMEDEVTRLKSGKINSSELLAIESWYQRLDQIQLKIKEEKNKLEASKSSINEHKQKFTATGHTEHNWQDQMELKLHKLKEENSILAIKEGDLRLKAELGHYIHNLHEGEKCPLCGSLDHPSPMEVDDLAKDFELLALEKQQLLAQQQLLVDQKNELTLASRLILEKTAEQNVYEVELQKIIAELKVHSDLFTWHDFDKEDKNDFDIKKAAIFALEKQIEDKEQEIKNHREQLQKISSNTQKAEKALNELTNEQSILASRIEQNLAIIRVINPQTYASNTKQDILEQSQLLHLKITKTENDYFTLTKSILEIKTKYAQIKGQHTETQEQYSQLTAKLQELQITLNNLLLEFGYPDIATIIEILSKNIDLAESRKMIQNFYLSYTGLESRIKELQNLIQQDHYTDDLYEGLKSEVEIKQQNLEVMISTLGAIKEELKKLTVDLDRKKELLEKYNYLESRKENLKLLDNMFRGNGFVNYVSSIHLERLCDIANIRFHRLTKNQLSLVINENNEFEVKDYLNNGYRRSVKTLSGGQGFQASLCLALALAENIQSLNKADKNFFFIDEGFGTQDSESIHAVFETLNYLNKENRIVGIISHVEELKERIPRTITVYNDPELGSIIREN